MGFCRSTSAVAPDDPSLEPVASKASSKGKRGFRKKGSGRLEGPPAPEAAPSRDGLHSAPSGEAPAVKQDPVKVDRAGLHSAPAVRAVQPAVPTEEALPNPKQLGDFLLESADGVTAAEADAYLSDIIGPKLTQALRASEWAARVHGLESLQAMVKRSGSSSPAEQLALFKASITALARLLQDKVVPVYLPALQLLEETFAAPRLGELPQALPTSAVDLLAPQLVTRAGSSNVRAREDSSSALLRLARNPCVGAAAVAPHTLRALPNAKSQHAALGRLELLNSLITDCGVGQRSVGVEDACDFVMPFCDSASDKIREAAMGVLHRLHAQAPDKTLAHVTARKPNLAQGLTISVAPAGGGGGLGLASSASSGRPKLAPLARGPSGLGASRGGGGGRGGGVGAAASPPAHTPPQVAARAQARQVAAELGVREKPPPAHPGQKKKLRHPGGLENGDGQRGAGGPQRTPTPMPGPGGRYAPGASPRGGAKGLFDEVEEGLMESILDAEAHGP